MKIVPTSNGVLISIYVLLVVYTLATVNRSGNDAAGRGWKPGLPFLKKGADPKARPFEFSPILFEVMKYGENRSEKVKLLLDYGADPNATAASNGYNVGALYSPLLFAAHQELWDVCQLLLERGADPSYRVPEEEELIRIMKQTSYYAGNAESQGEDLQKIMDKHEKS